MSSLAVTLLFLKITLQEAAQETEIDTPEIKDLGKTTDPTPAPTAPNSKVGIPEQAAVEQPADSGEQTPEVPDGWGQGILNESVDTVQDSSQEGIKTEQKKAVATPEKIPLNQDLVEPPASPPPPKLSRSAADQRLRRCMKPRENGTYRVPQIVRKKWEDLATRDEVFALFEKSGFDAAACFKRLYFPPKK